VTPFHGLKYVNLAENDTTGKIILKVVHAHFSTSSLFSFQREKKINALRLMHIRESKYFGNTIHTLKAQFLDIDIKVQLLYTVQKTRGWPTTDCQSMRKLMNISQFLELSG
jgi:hypothetical protein